MTRHVYDPAAGDWICLDCGLVTDHCGCPAGPEPDLVLAPCWDAPEKIADFRAAVLAQHEKGYLTDAEKGIALGNLAESEALLRLKQARQGNERK